MHPHPPAASPRTGADRVEEAYDRYARAALEGNPPDPAAFLAAYPDAGPELQRVVHEMHRLARARRGSPDGLPFERIGPYRILRSLGKGGMGLVFLAVEEPSGRTVALKILRPEMGGSPTATARFRREVRAAEKLRHPQVVSVLDSGEADGTRYLVMEYLPGDTLEAMLRNGCAGEVDLSARVRWGALLARALQHAHERGLVHRDVKPSNILLHATRGPMLLDFGLARNLVTQGATLTESFVGSPRYASPEQLAKAAVVDARTDVYSLGVTLYELVTGSPAYDGDSVEAIFRQILAASPVRPRRRDAAIPRDLETAILHAMEPDPTRRYPTAKAFAEDLEAILALRPIRARRPDLRERLRRGARRRPAVAAFVLTAVFAGAVWVGAALWQVRASRLEAHARARLAVAGARDQLEAYRASREGVAEVQRRVDFLTKQMVQDYMGPEEEAELDRSEGRVDDLRRAWEEAFYGVLDRLRQAERLDPELEGLDAVRAELYAERFRESRDSSDVVAAEFYRERALGYDTEGRFAEVLRGDFPVQFVTDPPGARVYLYRYEAQERLVPGGGPRLVPVPYREEARIPFPAGTWALRVVEGAGQIEDGDLIYELADWPLEGTVLVSRGSGKVRFLDRLASIQGEPVRDGFDRDRPRRKAPGESSRERVFRFERPGASVEIRGEGLEDLGIDAMSPAELVNSPERPPIPALAWTRGELRAVEIPAGVEVRPTAAPLPLLPQALLGVTPVEETSLPEGEYVAWIRRPGFEDLRVGFPLPGPIEAVDVAVSLVPAGSAPRGFVRVIQVPRFTLDPFWIQEREVTAGEYLAFLNDPETLEAIERSPEAILYPRQPGKLHREPLWPRAADGRFRLPEGWRAVFPVVGVSWDDANAYARWWAARHRLEERGLEAGLPTRPEFLLAGMGGHDRAYAYGSRFRSRYAHTCFSHRKAYTGPVLDHPVDESPLGVFDTCGGAFEWLDAWFDEARGLRHLSGGSWGRADPELLRLTGGIGATADFASGETGFRLVLRPVPGKSG